MPKRANPSPSSSSQRSAPCIAFYAPLKSPRHPVPSGDRKIAQLFSQALSNAGFEVQLASQLRSFDKTGNAARQQRLIALATREVERILRRWARHNIKPSAWFSYHLYYKAADLIGPQICRRLNIPYIVAEASWAEKRATSAWSTYHALVSDALQLAAKVICINPVDRSALCHYYRHRLVSPIVSMQAFIETVAEQPHSCSTISATHTPSRASIATQYGLNPAEPWLLCIAMMRAGDKHLSFKQLSTVISQLKHRHQLLIIGDGAMRQQVIQLFAAQKTVHFAGSMDNLQIKHLLPAFEILLWPAVNEALGMVFLEAQQAGLAVVSADHGGVSSVVAHQHSGYVCAANDTSAMANKVDQLLSDPQLLTTMQGHAKRYIDDNHSLTTASLQLRQLFIDVMPPKTAI